MVSSLSPSLLPTFICSEIGNHQLDQILKMSFVVGCKVKLSSSCSDHSFLKPGQVGVLIEDDGSSVPFKVEFEGNTHWYTSSKLELADASVRPQDAPPPVKDFSSSALNKMIQDTHSHGVIANFTSSRCEGSAIANLKKASVKCFSCDFFD
jgi:hypothetical protein